MTTEAEERLLDALREQLVAGQVETLLSLEKSTAALRIEARAVVEASVSRLHEVTTALDQARAVSGDFGSSARDAAAYLASAAAEVLAMAASEMQAEAQSALGRVESDAARAESSLAAAVQRAADTLSHRVETSLVATAHQVDQAAAALAQATTATVSDMEQAQRTVVDAIGQAAHVADIARSGLAEQVARAGEAVRAAGQQASSAVDASRDRLIEELVAERREWAGVLSDGVGAAEQAVGGIADRVAEAGVHATEGLAEAGERVLANLTEEGRVLSDQAASFAITAEALLQRWEKRDARRDTRVEALLARVEAGWRDLAEAAARDAARRDARELAQERQRAEEFARVLADVLNRAGVSTRGLRERVLRVLDENRASSVEPASIDQEEHS